MDYAGWRPVQRRFWLWSIVLGFAVACSAACIALLMRQRVAVAGSWSLLLLQVGLGPVLEEILFRGYVLELSLPLLRRLIRRSGVVPSAIVVNGVVFASLHLMQTGAGWREFAVISGAGILYC